MSYDESEVSLLKLCQIFIVSSNGNIHLQFQPSARYSQLFDMQSACCVCLAELSFDYTNGQTIIERNGIYILALLLFPENEGFRELEKYVHLQVMPIANGISFLTVNQNRNQERFHRFHYSVMFSEHFDIYFL